MAATKFIHKLDPETFQDLYSKLEWIHLKENELFLRRGFAVEEAMYIIIEGKLGLFTSPETENEEHVSPGFGLDGEQMELVCSFIQGDSFGEFSLLIDEKVSHKFDHRALCTTTLVKISRELYDEFVASKPAVFLSFVKTTLASKWRNADYVLNSFFEIPKNYSHCHLTSSTVNPRTCRISSAASITGITNFNGGAQNLVNIERKSPSQSPFLSNNLEPLSSPKAQQSKPDSNRIFLDPNDTLFQELSKDAEIIHLMPGEVLYKFGAQSLGKCYISLKGKLVAYNEGIFKSLITL